MRHINGVTIEKRSSVPRLIALVQGRKGPVAAIGIAGIIGLAHAAHQIAKPAPYASAAASVKNRRFRPGTKVFGNPVRAKRDLGVAPSARYR